MTTIHIIRDRLTDGSEAFGVRIAQGDRWIDIDCVSERHAETMSGALLITCAGNDGAEIGDEVLKNAGWEG